MVAASVVSISCQLIGINPLSHALRFTGKRAIAPLALEVAERPELLADFVAVLRLAPLDRREIAV
jgi:hypothetical protein